MKRLPFWFLSAAALLLALPAQAADGSCRFRARGLTLNFGALDPSSNLAVEKPIVASTTFANMAGDCASGTMTISVVGGASRQMVSGANTISYTLTGFPITLPKPGNAPPGNPAAGYTTWFAPNQIQGVIQWAAYADAPAGTYTDSVTIAVNP